MSTTPTGEAEQSMLDDDRPYDDGPYDDGPYDDGPYDDVGARRDRLASRIFIHVGLFGCICLQRFCIYLGDSPLFISLPILLGLIVWMMATGRAEFRPLSLGLYAGVAATGLVSTLIAVNFPDPRISDISVASLFSLLMVYAAMVVRPTARFDKSATLGIFMLYVKLCAVLGIVEYLAQFVGIRLFSFMLAFPVLKPILVEPLFNYNPVVAYGSTILRSNGFFLVEPSTFSQLLMLGVVVDFFIRRDWRFLPLYGLAYLFTYAGTGILALVLACLLYVVIAPRHSFRIVSFGVAGLILLAVVGLAFPAQLASLTDRTEELSYSGSSGYARYMTQFDVIAATAGETRTLIGYGPGALERAIFYTPGGGNPAIKLFTDYGIIGLLMFLTFFFTAVWRRDMLLLSLFIIVNFQFGGGNLLFTPFIVLATIICIWSSAPQFKSPG